MSVEHLGEDFEMGFAFLDECVNMFGSSREFFLVRGFKSFSSPLWADLTAAVTMALIVASSIGRVGSDGGGGGLLL